MKHVVAIWIIGTLVFGYMLTGVLAAPVEDMIVEAQGLGTSEQEALLNAKREAVETGIGTVLISRTEIQNYQLQKDVILTKTMGAVKRVKILDAEKLSTGGHRVRIEAVVSLAGIKEDLAALKILLESMDKPRMMVIIQEEGSREAENAVIDYLTEKQFDLVDPASLAADMRPHTRLVERAAGGDSEAAAEIGASHGADYVIFGRVSKSSGSHSLLQDTGMVSAQATISAKVIDCSNARIIASKNTRSAAAHISEDVAHTLASRKAGTRLMDDALFEAVVAAFQDMLNNGTPLDVRILNVSSYQEQKNIRRYLTQLPGVVSVNKRSFGGGQLSLTITFKGNADSFCEAVDGRSHAGKALSVKAVSGHRIRVQLQ